MRIIGRIWLILVTVVLLLAVSQVMAYDDDETSQASFTAPTLVDLSLTDNLSFTGLGKDEFDVGYMEDLGAHVLTVSCNTTWTLTIESDALLWSGGSLSKPSTDLQWTTAVSYAGLSTTAAQVTTGSAGKDLAAATVDFKLLLSYASDTPGTYTLGITYTLTAP